MAFPNPPRVLYRNNPIVEVICQLRFPTILRIDSDAAPFQEQVRAQFPIYREEEGLELSLPPQVAQLVKARLPGQLTQSGRQFLSADEKWMVALNRDFLALSTKTYKRWEEFRDHLETPLKALLEVYKPAFFSRVGLRYQNMIVRSNLGLADVGWDLLLQRHIASEFSAPEVVASIEEAAHQLLINLPEAGGKVRLRHGLAAQDPSKSGRVESCYLIDSDFFVDERTETGDAHKSLERFNQQARRLFRWCVTDRLHDAMVPEPIA